MKAAFKENEEAVDVVQITHNLLAVQRKQDALEAKKLKEAERQALLVNEVNEEIDRENASANKSTGSYRNRDRVLEGLDEVTDDEEDTEEYSHCDESEAGNSDEDADYDYCEEEDILKREL